MKTGENQLVQRIARALRQTGKERLRLGIGDDAALLRTAGGYLSVLTCDWFLEGRHFLRDRHSADSVGWKCLARAVSDVAAMGGTPKAFLLSLALPGSHTGRWLDDFLKGLRRASQRFGCELAGGDTTRNEQILINVAVIGEVPERSVLLRSGAQPGDLLYVSGRLGEAEFGLRLIRGRRARNRQVAAAARKHLYPEPRLALGRWLAEKSIATAMMDLSDGLSTDLSRLCMASRVGARIYAGQLPTMVGREKKFGKGVDLIELALHGGDDYELLFTVPPSRARLLPAFWHGVPLTRIGEIARERRLLLLRPDGREQILKPQGWDPFQSRSRE